MMPSAHYDARITTAAHYARLRWSDASSQPGGHNQRARWEIAPCKLHCAQILATLVTLPHLHNCLSESGTTEAAHSGDLTSGGHSGRIATNIWSHRHAHSGRTKVHQRVTLKNERLTFGFVPWLNNHTSEAHQHQSRITLKEGKPVPNVPGLWMCAVPAAAGGS